MKLASLLPFMENEELEELARKIINKEVKGISITLLFPFLHQATVDELVEEMIKNGSKKELYQVLPFLSQKRIQTLYERVQKGEIPGFKEEVLIPFLGNDKIKEIFSNLVKEAEQADENEAEEDIEVIFQETD